MAFRLADTSSKRYIFRHNRRIHDVPAQCPRICDRAPYQAHGCEWGKDLTRLAQSQLAVDRADAGGRSW